MCYFREATSIYFLFHRNIQHVGRSLQKYLEFSLKNLEKNRNFGLRKKCGNHEIWMGMKRLVGGWCENLGRGEIFDGRVG